MSAEVTPEQMAEWAALVEHATPGPWVWAGNVDTGEPYLAGRAPGMGASILAIGTADRSKTDRRADDVRSYAHDCDLDPEEEVDRWAEDQYGEPIKEPRLWFYTDHMAVDAREHVVFEVAPDATSRDDRRVYRADITDIRHPDARFIAAARTAVPALLDEVERLTAERDWLREERYCPGCGRPQDWTGETSPGAPCMGCGRYPAARTNGAEAERDAALRDVAILRPAAAHAERAEAELRALREGVERLVDFWEQDGLVYSQHADELRGVICEWTARVGTGASGGGDPALTEATLRVNRSVDCPEAPAQAHPRALLSDGPSA